MKKSDRQKIFDKYAGHCAYCGCLLEKGFHVDEIEPCRRLHIWDAVNKRWQHVGYSHPDRLHIDNQNPACPSCNINKHSGSLEDFRGLIAGFMKHLNKVSTQYKIAKRYGLITETDIRVKFYFETDKAKQK